MDRVHSRRGLRLNQTQLVMVGCVVLNLFHYIKKLGHYLTKLIAQFLSCLVKNDHWAWIARPKYICKNTIAKTYQVMRS